MNHLLLAVRAQLRALYGAPWRSPTVVALLIVLALLGHDLLMITPAVAAADHHPVSAQRHAMAHSAPDSPDLPAISCDATREATTVASSGQASHVLALPALPRLIATTPADSTAPAWQEPPWPPGASRAFLQVFRI